MESHILLAAAVTGTFLHAMMEPTNIMFKLKRFAEAVKTGTVIDPKMKGIDTRPKAYALGAASITFSITAAYLIINAINPSVEGAIQYSIAFAIVADLVLMVRVDKYHVLIERYTQAHNKNNKK